jgi:hypothetical protein
MTRVGIVGIGFMGMIRIGGPNLTPNASFVRQLN